MASRLLEAQLSGITKTETNSMSRRGSMRQLRNQRSMSILDARICLPQQLSGVEVCGTECAKGDPEAGDLAPSARGPSPQQTAVGWVLNAR